MKARVKNVCFFVFKELKSELLITSYFKLSYFLEMWHGPLNKKFETADIYIKYYAMYFCNLYTWFVATK